MQIAKWMQTMTRKVWLILEIRLLVQSNDLYRRPINSYKTCCILMLSFFCLDFNNNIFNVFDLKSNQILCKHLMWNFNFKEKPWENWTCILYKSQIFNFSNIFHFDVSNRMKCDVVFRFNLYASKWFWMIEYSIYEVEKYIFKKLAMEISHLKPSLIHIYAIYQMGYNTLFSVFLFLTTQNVEILILLWSFCYSIKNSTHFSFHMHSLLRVHCRIIKFELNIKY